VEPVWRIEMLGTLRVSREESSVGRFRTRRVALLLAHLAVYRTRLHFRDEIGELLWPESEPETIRRNLRQALFSLRHVLEPPPLPPGSILQVQQSRLRLNPDLVATDVADFDRAVAEARKGGPGAIKALHRAIDLYKGDLLPGFDEDWIIQERIRLEDLYVFALRQLVEHSRKAGDSGETIQYLHLALAKEPLNEEWHLALMREYIDSGRPQSAIKQFDELTAVLQEHLACDPSEEAYELRERAQSGPRVTPARVLDPTPEPAPSIEEASEELPKVIRLPVQITRFCGRQEEIEFTLDHLLRRHARLTTLVGPAGTGKTRLSIEVGRRLGDSGEWNVWFVPLADLADGALVLDAILDTLRARRSTEQDPLDQLRGSLHGRDQNLIILDNLEHIIEEATPYIAQIVERVPNLQLLVTSRQTLRLAAEHQIAIPPLPIPFASDHAPMADREELARLAEFSSIQLFVDRCQAIRPDFQLTLSNSRAVSNICAQLEGIPLAIELAAGLSGSFAPSQLAFHLQKRLTALTSRRRDMPIRHRSLRAAIDYSFDTLTPDLQRLFAGLSVFRSGFTVEAAYEVCYRDRFEVGESGAALRRYPHDGCLDMLMELQERSLIRSEGSDDNLPELRFRMLETFRQYAEEHLAVEEFGELRKRQAEFFRTHPAKPDYTPTTEERTRRHLWITREFDNYIAALDYYLEQDQVEPCIELLGTLLTTWTSRGPRSIERGYIRQIADRASTRQVEPNARILLLRMLGTTFIRSSEYWAAYRVCQTALKVAEENNLPEQIAVCHLALATCSGYLGNLDDCLVFSERVLEILPEDSVGLRERAYLGIGAVRWGRGESEAAEAAFMQASEHSARTRGGEPDTLILYNLARVCLDDGRLDEAMSRLGEAMRICRRMHDEFGLATCLSLVSRYHWLKGSLSAAIATGHEALLKHRETDFLHWSLLGIFQQALILVDMKEWETSTILLAATQGIGKPARVPDERDHVAAIAKIKANVSPGQFERAWARGLAMGAEEAFRIALQYK